jgi:hypothetical protein
VRGFLAARTEDRVARLEIVDPVVAPGEDPHGPVEPSLELHEVELVEGGLGLAVVEEGVARQRHRVEGRQSARPRDRGASRGTDLAP